MKSLRVLTFFVVSTLLAYPVIAHHAAEDMVDEEIYAMIDAMVADTPHATIDFDDTGSGMIQLGISTNRVSSLEGMVADGLLEYVSYLDGEVSLTIDFIDHNQVELVITQVAPTGEAEKSAGTVESATLDEIKAEFR